MTDRRFPFEKVARLDSPERHERQPPAPLVEVIASAEPRRVLDIGVGTGYFAIPLARRLPEAVVVGSDVEPRMLEIFRDRATEAGVAERVEFLQVPEADPNSVPLADGSVDVVFLVNLYHELPDRTVFLQEVNRVLRVGGRVLVCDWDPEGQSEAGPPRDHRIPRDTVQGELEAAGFGGLAHHPLYADNYTLVGTKAG